jgi:phosphoglycolate phosphatase-like HAD superfamily hydrolase
LGTLAGSGDAADSTSIALFPWGAVRRIGLDCSPLANDFAVLSFTRQSDFLVAIDSDGCAFDTMELKHKECFIPALVNHYDLQAVSKFARETWEFVNLYSTTRGMNRFPALVRTLDLLARRPEAKRRGVAATVPESLRRWVKDETRLGNPALEARVQQTGDAHLARCLAWSQEVNRAVDAIVRHVPPFPFVRESLDKLAGRADAIVCSATPQAALQKEWAEHKIDGLVATICGQETGTKKEMLAIASGYGPNRVLMMGDALGDYAAAQANGCLFFPINPGAEEASWQRFHEEAIDRFLAGQFAGQYHDERLDEFRRYLPEHPPWESQDDQ